MKKQLFPLLVISSVILSQGMFLPAAIAQRVVNINPRLGSESVSPSTSISGQFQTDGGAGVVPESVRILVNGQDVTDRSTITDSFFSYRPDQPFTQGQVQVEVRYRNTQGAQQSMAWTFAVQQPQAVQIESVTHTAVGSVQTPGTNFQVTINGTPGAQASVLLVENERTVRELSAREVSPGVYVANLQVETGDRVEEGIVVGRLSRQQQTTYAAAANAFSFGPGATTPPQAVTPTPQPDAVSLEPEFTSHDDGDRISGSGFTLVGQTQPGATVDVTVTSRISVLGVVNVGEETLLEREVRADRNGEFRIQVPAPRIPVPGTEYTVRAIASSGNQVSDAAELRLIQR